jgi:4-amino-4-deoxychorismate lyase
VRATYILGRDGGAVDVSDRGLAYGDGLFETMLVRTGRVQRLALHFDRLRQGCDRLALPLPETSELLSRIEGAAATVDNGNLKLILTRGVGPRGYAPPAKATPTVILLPASASVSPAPTLEVATLEMRLAENVKLAGIKHLNRLEQVLAQVELANLDADEGLMLSTSGAVIGGTSRNLFAVFGQSVKTPLVDRAGIAGVMRRAVLERCTELGIHAIECELGPEEIARADEIFMTNALVGIQSVSRVDGTALASDAVATRLNLSFGPPESPAVDG